LRLSLPVCGACPSRRRSLLAVTMIDAGVVVACALLADVVMAR
jgi:hypothetical protein